MPRLQLNEDNRKLTLIESNRSYKDLDTVQMQNLMIKLDYPIEALSDFLFNAVEQGHNVGELGMCGGFMYSYKQETL